MAVPRPLLLALLGVILLSATFMASRNARQTSESSKPSTQAAVVSPAHQPKPAPKPAKPATQQARASASEKHQARPVRHHAAPVSKPHAVQRAISGGHVVVLAFFQKRGADDSGTRQAVADVKRRHLAKVFTDDIDHIARYGKVVGKLGITQAPAVVIVDAKHHARLVEGYVDPGSLAQEVSDARK